jgi:uncharacterized protein
MSGRRSSSPWASGALSEDDQRAFIRAREQCGPDLACLLGTYDRRIDQLQMVMNGIKSKGPF